MSTNNFKPFGIGSGANVISQADYEALAALTFGFQSGKASSAQINKALRQGTVMASVLAQFISDSAFVDVLDDGNTALVLSSLKSAVTGRLLAVKSFTSSGTYTKTPGSNHIRVRVWGGGGGGANTATSGQAAGGGCGGGYAEGFFSTTEITTLAVTVGAGGVNVAAGVTGSGGAGGQSSFGSIITATGGTGSIQTSGGGVGSGGNIINFTANISQGSLTPGVAGLGGASFSSSTAAPHINLKGDDGSFPGGGGAGGNNSYASGKGASGYVTVEEYA
ncbi:hypothetical protein J1786_22235 [Rahnella sp. L72c]|uniref:Glycine-rich domain-containing protein n=2 Tax=Yersiniaceae TaxID=1903411 RepID=A0ABS6L6R5_9GAMM|nr:hypothetical protein [Rahnella perminowiae]MBU9823869.1 hypothetical protein [Rahnella perminowiae]MBU9837519.1 hypothetical protein [Rahnella perminowiae]